MKIAMIIRKLNVKGGTQRQMLSLARELQKRGHKIKIYTFAYSKEDCFGDLLELFEVIPFGEKNPYESEMPRNYFFRMRWEGKIAKELAQMMDRDFDLLNPHDQVVYKVAYYYKKHIKNIPSVWNMNDVPSLRWGYFRRRDSEDGFCQLPAKQFFYWIFDAYDRIKYIRAQDAVVAVDEMNRPLAKKYLHREAITIRNGPDLEHFAYTKKTPPTAQIKILVSGVFLPHRRFQDVIEAIKILTDSGYNATLSIIGGYVHARNYYQKLAYLAKELGIAHCVSFLGRISEGELLVAYARHDVYIYCHHLQSDGLAPFEAAACGMPVIVSRSSGAHEVLTDHENALFIEPKNPRDIAEKIKELIDNPTLYARLAEEGNRFVRVNFSWQKYADGLMKVFEEALQK